MELFIHINATHQTPLPFKGRIDPCYKVMTEEACISVYNLIVSLILSIQKSFSIGKTGPSAAVRPDGMTLPALTAKPPVTKLSGIFVQSIQELSFFVCQSDGYPY